MSHFEKHDRRSLEDYRGGHFFLCFFLCILVLDNPRTAVYNKVKERRCPASAAVMLPPSRHIVPRQEEVQFFVILLTIRMFLHENLREDSTMEILNTVIALLGLLATVILGTAKITWTIAQVFFRDMHHAKHYIKK